MEIITNKDDNKLVIELKGRLNASTAPQLEAELRTALTDVNELIFDFKELTYVSSAGLRVLIDSHKRMTKQGIMIIKNVCEDVKAILNVTGFVDILNIE